MEKVIEMSNKIWEAMKNEELDTLRALIHPEAMFVHMTRSLSRDAEIDVIAEKNIDYKHVDFHERHAREMDNIVILLNKLELTAVVRGNEVTNLFMVTETYTKENDGLKMSSLTFSKIIEDYNIVL